MDATGLSGNSDPHFPFRRFVPGRVGLAFDFDGSGDSFRGNGMVAGNDESLHIAGNEKRFSGMFARIAYSARLYVECGKAIAS